MNIRPLEELPEWRNPQSASPDEDIDHIPDGGNMVEWGDREELSRREVMAQIAAVILALGIPTIFGIHGCRKRKEHHIQFRDHIDLNPPKDKAPQKDVPPPPSTGKAHA